MTLKQQKIDITDRVVGKLNNNGIDLYLENEKKAVASPPLLKIKQKKLSRPKNKEKQYSYPGHKIGVATKVSIPTKYFGVRWIIKKKIFLGIYAF